MNDLVSMPAYLFYHFPTAICDIYLNLVQEGENVFVPRYKMNDPIERKEIDEFIESGIQDFYLTRESLRSFSLALVEQVSQGLNDLTINTPEHAYTFKTLSRIIRQMGMKPMVVEMARKYIEILQYTADRRATLEVRNWVRDLKTPKYERTYRVMGLTTVFVGQYVFSRYGNHSRSTLLDYTAASFLADLGLKNDQLIHCRTREQLAEYNQEEQLEVESHAAVAANMFESCPFVNQEILRLIRQHHGSVTGEELPAEISSHIAESVNVYILMENLAWELIYNPADRHSVVYARLEERMRNTSMEAIVEQLPRILGM